METKPTWITSVTTDDLQTGKKCRLAFYLNKFDTVIEFGRLEETNDGKKAYSVIDNIRIPQIQNSGFETFFGVASAKINATRTDEQETRYSEVVKTIFEQNSFKVLRFSYSIAPGAKNDYKRARSASLKLYSFSNYQQAKEFLVRQQNGSYDLLPENNCTFSIQLKLMPKYNTTGMGGKSYTEAESFLNALQAVLLSIESGILHTRVFNSISAADEEYQVAKNAQNYVSNAEQINTNISTAPSDNADDFDVF